MPGFDGTGPMGAGPMTGGGRGYCVLPYGSYANAPFAAGGFGRGRGRAAFGSRQGRRNWYWATGLPGWARAQRGLPAFGGWANPYTQEISPKEQLEMLKSEAAALKTELEAIQSHISALEKTER